MTAGKLRFAIRNRSTLGGLTCILLLCETEELNPVRCRDGREVLLYSLFPLYTEERDLEKAQGIEPLFHHLTAANVSMVVDPGRVNSAPGKVG